jgi:hypothetical protein
MCGVVCYRCMQRQCVVRCVTGVCKVNVWCGVLQVYAKSMCGVVCYRCMQSQCVVWCVTGVCKVNVWCGVLQVYAKSVCGVEGPAMDFHHQSNRCVLTSC